MPREMLPIKFFAKRKVDELKTEAGGNSDKVPGWVLSGDELIQRSISLSSEFEQFKRIIMRKESENSIIPFVFEAKISQDATSKSRRKEISNLFRAKNKNNVIGLLQEDKLIIKIDSLDESKVILERLKDYSKNSYGISCIEKIEAYSPCIYIKEFRTNYKVKLINFQEVDKNKSIQVLFEDFITAKNICFTKTDYTENLTIYNLQDIDTVKLDEFKTNEIFEAILSIEPMPKHTITLDFFQDEEEIDIIYPHDGTEYVTIGILDNGISNIPHLKPWILDESWSAYPPGCIDPTHGTFVSGVAIYGDILEGEEWIGNSGLKLFDATIFPDTTKEGIEEDELIRNIKEVIKYKGSEIKIWNLSISIEREVVDNSFSDLAVTLDDLQDKYNILICKSAGNCKNFINNNSRGRINEGADSVRALVVGSIAHEEGKVDLVKIDDPSPFTRIGPGPSYIIKPEVVHYGGNAGIDKNGNLKITGVKSFSKNGLVSKLAGTSYSTPRITALAAGIYQELNEEFDPLLLKALIIHSASYSKGLNVLNEERTKHVGFGKPKSISEIIYNSPNEVTLILRDTLNKGDYIDIMDLPMPECLIKDGYYTGQITATLVYNPILDPSQKGEYCQSNIDIKLGSYDEKVERDIEKRNILNPVGRFGSKNILLDNIYSKRVMRAKKDDFALKERLLIQYGDKYYPVKKYAVDLGELTEGNKDNYLRSDKKWFLCLKGLYRDHITKKAELEYKTLSQEFCLILTIKDPSGEAQVYDGVSQKLDEYNFWHSNIKVSSNIENLL